MRFPTAELEKGTKGTVVLIFSIMQDGSMRDLRIWRTLNPACDEEALRLGALVRWHPATMGGTKVNAEHFLKVPFHARRFLAHQREETCDIQRMDAAEHIYAIAELDTLAAPQIPDGIAGIPSYIVEHMRYPEDAFRREIEGKVLLQFVVEASGSISNLHAKAGLGGGCDQEAMRLIRRLCWEPAVRKGLPVRSELELDVEFRLPRQ
ncbi:MAG: TonB family protein [Flavobacteriales bacterium]|nr:TonB family protein [Flavobacteriales bacterium]